MNNLTSYLGNKVYTGEVKKSFMERRVEQLNIEKISKQNLEAAMSELPLDSELLHILIDCHNLISMAQWKGEGHVS